MSCVVWPNQALLVQPQIPCNENGLAVANPIGRANDLGWYKDMGGPVFRNQIYGWRDVQQGRGQFSRSLLSYPPSDYELE